MRELGLASLMALAACASTAPAPPPSEPVPGFQARVDADPVWRPGDPEPIPAELASWQPYKCPPDAHPCAMLMGIELRNRCRAPAKFLVGPAVDGAPPEDAPVNELAAGDAVSAWIPSDQWIYLANPAGEYALRTKHAWVVVFLGEGACDRVSTD